MSYPEPRYLGEGGEVTAIFRPSSTPPDIPARTGTGTGTGNRTHYLATGAGTGGEFGLYKVEMEPRSPGPSTHFHRSISESFYVLTGTVRIYDGTTWIDVGPGGFVHVPPGGVHGFRNESGAPASMLLHFSPGAPRERYFEGLPELSSSSPEQRDAFFAEHDNIWLPD